MNLVHQNIIERPHTLSPQILAILLCLLDTEVECIDRVQLFHLRTTGSGKGGPPREEHPSRQP